MDNNVNNDESNFIKVNVLGVDEVTGKVHVEVDVQVAIEPDDAAAVALAVSDTLRDPVETLGTLLYAAALVQHLLAEQYGIPAEALGGFVEDFNKGALVEIKATLDETRDVRDEHDAAHYAEFAAFIDSLVEQSGARDADGFEQFLGDAVEIVGEDHYTGADDLPEPDQEVIDALVGPYGRADRF